MLEEYFKNFKQNIIGENQTFKSPFGEKKITYADWTASGRMYQPLEDTILNNILPWVANTHTETNVSGTAMTQAYQESKQIIKKHVNADKNDVLVFAGSGMTGVVNKLQRILGFKYPENFNEFLKNDIQFDEDDHMYFAGTLGNGNLWETSNIVSIKMRSDHYRCKTSSGTVYRLYTLL